MGVKRRPLSDAPDRLPAESRERLRGWARSHLPWGEKRLGRSWAECRDWHRAQGVLRADWEAAFRNWLRKEVEFEARPQGEWRHRASGGRHPSTSSSALGSRLGDELAQVIPLLRKGGG